jgi:hypothetical protein
VPRTVFVDAEGNIDHALTSRDPKYKYSADVDGPGELLGLMKKAAARNGQSAEGSRAAQ